MDGRGKEDLGEGADFENRCEIRIHVFQHDDKIVALGLSRALTV